MTRRHNRWLISQCEYNTLILYHSVKTTANEHITFIQLIKTQCENYNVTITHLINGSMDIKPGK